jgi:hypothetical protein
MTTQITIIRQRALQIEMSQIAGPVEAAHITVTHLVFRKSDKTEILLPFKTALTSHFVFKYIFFPMFIIYFGASGESNNQLHETESFLRSYSRNTLSFMDLQGSPATGPI